MFSTDFPYHDACTWFDGIERLKEDEKLKIGRDNARGLFRLGAFKDSEVPLEK
jgi:2,3-dihydroxybenzoate decarboxylase